MNPELFSNVLRAVWISTTDGMLVASGDGTIVGCNEQLSVLLGWRPQQLVGQKVEMLVPHERRDDHRTDREEYSRDPTPRRMGSGAILFALDDQGRRVPVDISLSRVDHDGQLFILAIIRDARARHQHEEELRKLGFHDALTGLYNRHYFDEELVRLQRGRQWPIAVVMADIDGLKPVNDQQGHEEGDRLIRRAADAISSSVRAADVVARLGGDEFVAIMPGLSRAQAEEVCQRIQQAASDSPGIALKISTGCAIAAEDDNLRAVLREADARMYDMKNARKSA